LLSPEPDGAGLGGLAALGFGGLVGFSAEVTAVKLSAAALAGGMASRQSPHPRLASIDDKCRAFMAVSLSFVVGLIIGKRSFCASGDTFNHG
jgi:hypothetical protein